MSEEEIWLDVNSHRADTLIEGELTEGEVFVDKSMRRGLDKDV